MTRKFGGGRKPIGTPSLPWSCVVVIAFLLAGISIVHNIYNPNLTLTPVDCVDGTVKKEGGRGKNTVLILLAKIVHARYRVEKDSTL